ncbi:hypothetical protein N7539_002027 [Penicillium diatomitis]|uniref:AMP-activated protein kinase glycogen-binding domain-containing protein n=1 Tax=Penicillium diatomitis TaxID=2819901 RepID=A0A9W9XHU2_9EURO|nr:uncharacterized protein N7539_002027 [Penicillium diatomitis]KAJ5493281.1 hypothetical protein N7539_002027 [Penicillium diatomitis]
MGTFTFKWPHSASEVFVTGTFDDWGKTVKLDRVGDVFMKEVSLPADKKVQYKFVVDGTWTTDSHAREENDGHDNINNVLLPEDIQAQSSTENHTPKALGDNLNSTAPAIMSGVTPDSTTAALAAEVPKEESNSGLPGAFPETPVQETEKLLSVNPIPASGGLGNPITLQPGEKVPEPSSIHTNTVDSTVKLDKESYEKSDSLPLGSSGLPGSSAATETSALPADTTHLIPESSLPMGGPAQQAAMADLNYTMQSAAPTSTTAALAAEVPLEESKLSNGTAAPAADVPEVVKESIGESHESPEAAANEEAVLEKKRLEEELQKRVSVEQSTGAHAPTTVAKDVPEIVKESIAQSHQLPGAAGDDEIVKEKLTMEDELHQRVSVEQSTGAPAPTTAAKDAPEIVKESIAESHQLPGAAGNEEAVKEKLRMEDELQKRVSVEQSAGAAAPIVTAAAASSAAEPAKGVPEVVKESIAESSQGPEAAANREAVTEKQAMESELRKTIPVEQSTGTPAPAIAATTATATSATEPAKDVPEVVKESIAESSQGPEAAANREAVAEKQAMESELQKTVPVVETAGAPAPATTAATQAVAPGAGSLSVPPVDSSNVSPTSTPPPGRAAPTSAAPVSAPQSTQTQEAPIVTTGVESSEAAAKSTPSKPTDSAQQSAKTSGSGELHPKDDKKKKRLSGFFSKLKEKLK